jgi:hypothetical protein
MLAANQIAGSIITEQADCDDRKDNTADGCGNNRWQDSVDVPLRQTHYDKGVGNRSRRGADQPYNRGYLEEIEKDPNVTGANWKLAVRLWLVESDQ